MNGQCKTVMNVDPHAVTKEMGGGVLKQTNLENLPPAADVNATKCGT